LRALFAGLGAIGQRHLRNLHGLAGNELEVAAYRVRGSARVITESLSLDPDGNIETAVHLFVEKPLADRTEGTEELAEIVESRGTTALVGYQMRFHPCYRALRALLVRGAIGRLLAVRAVYGEYLPDFHPYEDYRSSYASRVDLGGGVVLTQIHDIDYLVALLGQPESVYAVGGHLSSLEIDVEDVASTTFVMRSEGGRFPVHLHQDYVSRRPVRTCSLVGDSGAIEVDFRAATVHCFGKRGEPVESHEFPDFRRNDMFVEMMRHMISCLEGLEQPEVGIRVAMRTQRIAEAVLESLRTGNVQRL
jgi:predicted dehydrogenase